MADDDKPQGPVTRASMLEDSKPPEKADKDKGPVTMTGPNGTKVTTKSDVADRMKRQGFKG